jgi:hypothetical protein
MRRADGVHVRFVASGGTLAGAREVEPTLEDAYLLANLDQAAPAPPPLAAVR